MSSSEISLELTCDNPAAELLVVDSDFKIIAKGATPLYTKVVPGIYSFKAKIGAQYSETLEMVNRERAAHSVHLKVPLFESPMPLYGTSTSREYHLSSLNQFTGMGAPHVSLGRGSTIVLYVRDTSQLNFNRTKDQETEYASNFKGFRLLDADGEELVNFDEKSTCVPAEGYMGARVAVAPGHYVLGWQRGGRETRLSLNTASGWGLQVFLRLQPTKESSAAMAPDFSEAAFAYDPVDMPYSPDRENSRILEAARLALLDHRNVVSDELWREILCGKFSNPMLGIYGGHMLAAEKKVDLSLLDTVIQNTAELVGQDNPDIVALTWLYASKAGRRRSGMGQVLANLKGPPLLVQSWDALIACAQASNVDITALPAFRVAGNLTVSGIVLTWEHRTLSRAYIDSVATLAPGSSLPWLEVIWQEIESELLGRKAHGTEAAVPSLGIDVVDLTSEVIAADLRVLAKQTEWDKWLRRSLKGLEMADRLANFTALQRDLIMTLARTSSEPEIADGINASYVNSVMQAHRVPLSTVAESLRGLDLVPVSAEFFSRVRASLGGATSSET